MTKVNHVKFATLFAITVLLTTSIAVQSIPAYATHNTTPSRICGDKICDANNSDDAAAEREQMRQQVKSGPPPEEPVEEEIPVEEEMPVPSEETPEMEVMPEKMHGWQTATGTITSMQDPGVGHETHQLAIILPPSGNVYKGILSYSASEPIQLVALHGPLAEGEDAGQAIWTPDGTTKFALTFIDPETAMGSWMFTGNALAVHTMNTESFTVSYSVSYMENEMSDTVMTGTVTSMQDPGVGHETHQLAIILPPSDKTYSGLLTYSASEPIQLVALHGPLAEGEDAGQAIWTPDGTTKFALTFVDNEAAAGTWKFAGNALAVHTMNTEPFTVSYSVVAGQ
ncbi:MAG: hypothetical protein ACT4OW_04655 [Nitrososphaerota archaeon]